MFEEAKVMGSLTGERKILDELFKAYERDKKRDETTENVGGDYYHEDFVLWLIKKTMVHQ